MLRSPADVIRGLTTYNDWCQPSSASVILVGSARRFASSGDGLHPGLIDNLDEREELRRRFQLLPERDRTVLALWYMRGSAADEICRMLGVSRRQCFRIRAGAIRRLVQAGGDEAAA